MTNNYIDHELLWRIATANSHQFEEQILKRTDLILMQTIQLILQNKLSLFRNVINSIISSC